MGDGAGKQAAGMLTSNISLRGILAIAIDSCTDSETSVDVPTEDVPYVNSTT